MEVLSLTCAGVPKHWLASSLQQQYMQAPAWASGSEVACREADAVYGLQMRIRSARPCTLAHYLSVLEDLQHKANAQSVML